MNTIIYPWTISAECVTGVLMTGDWVLAAGMGATMVGRTAVEVVTKGRDCEKDTMHKYQELSRTQERCWRSMNWMSSFEKPFHNSAKWQRQETKCSHNATGPPCTCVFMTCKYIHMVFSNVLNIVVANSSDLLAKRRCQNQLANRY